MLYCKDEGHWINDWPDEEEYYKNKNKKKPEEEEASSDYPLEGSSDNKKIPIDY